MLNGHRGNWHGGRWIGARLLLYGEPVQRVFFLLRRGEGRESLEGYGDRISSIRVFGNARVSIYDDRDFQGARAHQRGCRGPPRLGQ